MSELIESDIPGAVGPFVQDGSVKLVHLRPVLKNLGIDLTEDDAKDAIRENGYQGRTNLADSDFNLLVMRIGRSRYRQRLLAEFRKADRNGDGLISPDEARAALEVEGVAFDEKELAAFIEMVDTDKDGKINYEEFIRFASPQ